VRVVFIYNDFVLQLSSYIEIVDFLEDTRKDNENKNSKDYHYMPETYNECQNRFGIVFHNNNLTVGE